MVEIDIALGTYNGARYLLDFLTSLDRQSYSDWRLIVRDDGSRDETRSILADWAQGRDSAQLPPYILDDSLGNLGVTRNFSECLRHGSSPYVMLADQDDIWFPDKVELALKETTRLEALHGKTCPIAVYCDLQVVDAKLQEIHSSFLHMQGQDHRRLPTLAQLLSQNVAPGCSMMVNRALLDVALPIHEEAVMHDWWLLLVARAIGQIGHIRRPGLAYRQHGCNQVGAKAGALPDLMKRGLTGLNAYRQRFRSSQLQALALAHRLPPEDRHQSLLQLYGSISQYPPVVRQLLAWRAGFGKTGTIRNMAFYALL